MKKIIVIIIVFCCYKSFAQNNIDISRIVLNSVIIDKDNKLQEEAKGQLLSKLEQIVIENGIGGNGINPRFIIAAKVNVLSKDIVSGPPQMIALNVEILFYIGDAVLNTLFSNSSMKIKGVGTNENKALINAIDNINYKNNQFENLISVGKNKIIEYYTNQCDYIIKKAKTLNDKQEYDAAIYELMQVPQVCKVCFDKSMDAVKPIFQNKVNRKGLMNLNEAKAKWNSSQNRKGGEDAAILLKDIDPLATCYNEAITLSETIRKKIEADDNKAWEFKLKKGYSKFSVRNQV